MIPVKSRVLHVCQFLLFIAICMIATLMVGCSQQSANDDQTDRAEPAVSESTLSVRLIGVDDSLKAIQPAVLSFHGEGGYLVASGFEVPADGAEHETSIDSESDVLLRVVSSPVFQDGAYYAIGEDSSFCFWIDKTPDGWELSEDAIVPEGVEVVSRSGSTCVTIDFSKWEKVALSVDTLASMADKGLAKSEVVVDDLRRMSEQTELDELDSQTLERNKLKVAAFTSLKNRLSSMTDGDIEALAKCYRDLLSVDWAVTAEEVPSFDE